MGISDKDIFVNYMFHPSRYKLANEFLLPLVKDFDIEKAVTDWINDVKNIKTLAGFDKIYDYKEVVNQQEQKILVEKVNNGERISIDAWQNRTKGTCIMAVNGYVFVATPIAILMVIHIGDDEVRELMEPALNTYGEMDRKYALYFDNNLNEIDGLLGLGCIHALADLDRCYYQYFYAGINHENVLKKRASYIIKSMKLE